jgi:membrane protein
MALIPQKISHKRLFILLDRSLTEFKAQNGAHLAASIAFNLFFSLFPLTFVALYISTFITGSTSIHHQVVRGISVILPQAQTLVQDILNNSLINSTEVNILAFLGAVWGGFSFFNAVRVSLNTAWNIDNPPSLLKGQLINFIMMVIAGLLILCSVVVTISINSGIGSTGITQYISRHTSAQIAANLLVTILTFIVFLLLYKFIPHHRPRWRDIWTGALISAIAFEITKVIFLYYIRVFQPYNMVYGSISFIIGFLMWAYLSSLIFIFIAKATYINLKMKEQSPG